MDIKCKYCQSENVYFSKKRGIYLCEDCGESFTLEEEKINKQKIFLSYGHDDNAVIVNLIKERLEKRGHEPWIDKSKIKGGNDWRLKITKGIEESQDFLAFVSKHSIRDPGVCLDEISIGVGNWNVRMQPVKLEKNVDVPNSISETQWIDLSDWRDYKDTPAWDEYFENKLNEIFSAVEDDYGHMVKGNISTLKDTLNPLTHNIKMRLILRNEIVARKWLFEKIDAFISNKNDKTMVIYGRPGAGKSIISAYLSNYNHHCVSTFLFEWNNDVTKDFRRFLFSIIFQLGASIIDYQHELIKFLKRNDIQSMSNDEIITRAVFEPLNNLIDGNRDNKVIALDALDEVMDEDGTFINNLLKLINATPSWIKFVITSRPESLIKEKLIRSNKLFLDDYDKETSEDIKEYISKYIEDKDIVNQIVEKSNGSFVYASEMVKLYNNDPNGFDIKSVPVGLYGIYYSNFDRLFPDNNEYQTLYKKFFEVLLAAKEQLKVEEMKNILSLDDVKINEIIKKLSSYIVTLRHNDNIYLEIFHKSFWDFLVSEDAGEYRISLKEGNNLFKEYILSNVDTEDNFSTYVMEYAFDHISRLDRENLCEEVELKLVNKLLSSAKLYGNLNKEYNYLEYLNDNYPKSLDYYFAALEYYKKTDGTKLSQIADEIYQNIEAIKDEETAFKMVCQIGYSYFYAGYSKKSYDLIIEERNKHDASFWEDEMHEAEYWHVIALTAHDLDKNDDVIAAAKIDLEKYKRNKKYYSLYVTMVNLFDGFMAYGDLESADKIAKQVLINNEDRYYIHADDIIKICYANLLQTEGRIMEAFDYYEDGLQTAKSIQLWDYLYGSIWRELNVAKFYDKTALNNLLMYKEKCKEMGYRYLIALSDTFYIISSYLLHEVDKEKIMELYQEILTMDMPGIILESSICMMVLSLIDINEDLIDTYLSLAIGVKGYPEIVSIFYDKYQDQLSPNLKTKLEEWISVHVKGIIDYQKQFFNNLVKDQDDAPYLSVSICPRCQGKCCYDGIYIEEDEEKLIKQFVEKHPKIFNKIVRPYIVDGDWPGMRSTRKTEKVPYDLYDDSFPKHFTKTKCCFQMENGECLLQRAATDLQLHPWKIKPAGCWSFPLRWNKNGEINPPLTNKSKDPHYIDESYPGYVTFLPCVKEDINGQSWKDKYHNEIEYFYYLKNKNHN